MNITNLYDFLGRDLYNKPHERFVSFLNLNKKIIGKTALDLCCGTGRYSKLLSSNNIKVIGVDIDKKSIEIARNKYKNDKNIKFETADILKYSTKKKFDTILFMGNSLAHFSMDEMEIIIKKYKKNLKKRGLFIVELSSPFELLRKRELRWRNFKETLVEFSIFSGIIKRKISKNKEYLIITNYLWFPFMLDRIFKRNKMELFKKFEKRNHLFLIYKNE